MDTTFDDVQEMLEDRRQALGVLKAEMAVDELFITGSSTIQSTALQQYFRGFPKKFTARIPSIGIDALQRLRNQMVTGETPDPRVLLPATRRGEKKDEREKQDRVALQQHIRDELTFLDGATTESPFLTVADHIIGLGAAIISYPFLKDRIPKPPPRQKPGVAYDRKLAAYERDRNGAVPFKVEAVHPQVAFWDPYCDPTPDMILEEEVALGRYARLFPHLELPKSMFGSTGKLITYCSATEYGYWLDNRPLLTKKDGANEDGMAPNPVGVLWFRMARSGFGYRDAKGSWENLVQGIIRGARPAILSLITDYNVQEIIKLLYVWPQEEFEVTGEQGRQDLDQYARGPGALWEHGTQVRRIPTDATQIPSWAFEIQNYNSGLVEAHTGSRVLTGIFEDDTASGLRTRLGLARAPIRVTQRALEHMEAGMIMDLLYIQKHHLAEPLIIPTANGYQEFDAARIPDKTRVELDLTPATQEDIAFQLDDLMKRKTVHAASTRRILESDPSVQDVDEEMVDIDADRIMEMGDLLQAASQMAMQKFQERVGMGQAAPATPEETMAPNPGQLPGENSQVSTLGSPLDVARTNGNVPAAPPLVV